MAKLVSTTYGDALFDLALEENVIDDMREEIAGIKEVFLQNEELSQLLHHPEIPEEEKFAVLETVFRGRVSDEILGFFYIIVTKNRCSDIVPICEYFLGKVKKYKGIGSAKVVSAVPLTEEQKEAVTRRLLDTTKYTSFEITWRVDPAIIGGLVIRMDDRVMDSSLKTQMDTLSRQLSKIPLS